MKPKPRVPLTLRLQQEEKELLEIAAIDLGVEVVTLIRMYLRPGLQSLESGQRWTAIVEDVQNALSVDKKVA